MHSHIMSLSNLWTCSGELAPQKVSCSGQCFNFQVSPVVGSFIVAFWESSVSESGRVMSMWSLEVAGNV